MRPGTSRSITPKGAPIGVGVGKRRLRFQGSGVTKEMPQ